MGIMNRKNPAENANVLAVGGNAVSAFLSWRLQATNSCDVTLVWKSGYEHVSQYGVSFKSEAFGNERFKPRHVVRTPEEAAAREQAYDYVILCVKALPDVYDLSAVIESVVAPQHTCILVNTTNSLGVESHLEQRFPTNVVLSLVSAVDIVQSGVSEFEHTGSSDLWVGPASKNDAIPAAIQNDMAEALAITLNTAHVNCKVAANILQQQYERMIGPVAFYPASVLFETSNHAQLLEKVGLRQLVNDVIDELMALAKSRGGTFPEGFKEKTIEAMVVPSETPSTMYQDFMSKRPMEVETYLGAPIKLATETGIKIPRIETLYAMLHHANIVNQSRPPPEPSSPVAHQPPPRLSSAPHPRGMSNGMRGGRSYSQGPPRRGPPPMGRPPNGMPPPRGPPPQQGLPRDLSYETPDLDEFSHLVLYEDAAEDVQSQNGYANGGPAPNDLALKERELMLRQKELQLRQQEMNMRRGNGRRVSSGRDAFDDGDEDYFDPMDARGPPPPHINPDDLDMMSVTSRKNRKAPSASQFRKNPEMAGGGSRPPSSFSRHFGFGRNRTSARIMEDVPGMHDSLYDNPMMSYSSNRYGSVDRREMHHESRANSLTAARLNEAGGPGPYPPSRRTSQSPGHPPPHVRGMGPNGMAPNGVGPNGMGPNGHGMGPGGRPSPPGMMRAPVPRHPPGQGNAVAPHQVEQHAGVRNHPSKRPSNNRILTGSANTSAGSGDSGRSANIDSENSAQSSRSSLEPRHGMPTARVK